MKIADKEIIDFEMHISPDGYPYMEFEDDVHQGEWLPKDKMIEARRLEMDFFRKMGVYTKVPRSEARRNKCSWCC